MMNQTKYRLMQTLPAFDLQDILISNAWKNVVESGWQDSIAFG